MLGLPPTHEENHRYRHNKQKQATNLGPCSKDAYKQSRYGTNRH